jgi:hypothetical protein
MKNTGNNENNIVNEPEFIDEECEDDFSQITHNDLKKEIEKLKLTHVSSINYFYFR